MSDYVKEMSDLTLVKLISKGGVDVLYGNWTPCLKIFLNMCPACQRNVSYVCLLVQKSM